MKYTACFKNFVKYSSLNVLGMIGLSCYILADTFFVSKGLGAEGLAALNLAIPVYSFIHGSGLMIGIGGGTRYSILKGQNKRESVNQIFTNAAVFTLCLSALFFLTGILFSGSIAHAFGAQGSVFQMSKTYIQVILLFAPVFMMNNLLLCFVRNDGAPQLSMAAMIGGSLSNIVLDYLFIFPLGMGIFGAVFATSMAPIISMMILSPYFLRKKNQFRLNRCRISAHLLLHTISSGLPSLITEVSSGIVIIVFNMILMNLEGNIGVAAYGVIANLSLVVMSIYTGIAQGIQPLISGSYGKGCASDVQALLRYALTTVLVLSAAIYIGVFFGADTIAGVFNSGHDPLLQGIAVDGLKCYFTACGFAGINIILSVYFTSTDCPLPAHMISLLRGFFIIIPLAFLMSALMGITGTWFAFPVTECLVSMAGALLYVYVKKKRSSEKGRPI